MQMHNRDMESGRFNQFPNQQIVNTNQTQPAIVNQIGVADNSLEQCETTLS